MSVKAGGQKNYGAVSRESYMRDPEALEPADPEALYREVWMLKPKTLKRSLEGLEPDPYTWKPQSPRSPKNPVARKPSTLKS